MKIPKNLTLKNLLIKTTSCCAMLSFVFLSSCSEAEQATDEVNVAQQSIELVPNPSKLITIKGTSDDGSTARKTTKAAGNDRGRFNITLKYVVPVTERQQEVFEDAAARWERIIIKDVPSFTGVIPSAFGGLPPAIDGTVDDILIEVALLPLDGPGGTLGAAGPRFVRTSDFLTLTGVMFFDTADLAFLDQLDLFEEVIVHEMGHVLGVGTLWNSFGRSLRESSGDEFYFDGETANKFWNAEGGLYELPIENLFTPGTRLSHWKEFDLNNELMTGFLNLGENPLSRITAGSMRDLGYGTANVGESYDLPRGTEGVDISELAERHGEAGINIAEMEVILEPIGVVITDEN